MQVLANTGGVAMTNCFLIVDEIAKQCVLIDAPDHTAGPLVREAHERGWEIMGLWLTHGHFDHIADHPLVRSKVLIHPRDAEKLRNPQRQLDIFEQISGFHVPLKIEPREPDGPLEDGQELKVGSLRAKVIHTPGHSPGHVSFHFESEAILIGGDLIIGGSVGRTDLPDSDAAEMNASIRRVMELPDETRLLGGHGPASTLGQERATNDYVRSILEQSTDD